MKLNCSIGFMMILKDDGMNFDGDLDFDFNTQPKKMADMSRREIVKEAASGFSLRTDAISGRWLIHP
jgi:hypothetical protein